MIGSPTSSRTRSRNRAAISTGAPAIRRIPRTSMNASSIDSPSTTGDVSSKIVNTALRRRRVRLEARRHDDRVRTQPPRLPPAIAVLTPNAFAS